MLSDGENKNSLCHERSVSHDRDPASSFSASLGSTICLITTSKHQHRIHRRQLSILHFEIQIQRLHWRKAYKILFIMTIFSSILAVPFRSAFFGIWQHGDFPDKDGVYMEYDFLHFTFTSSRLFINDFLLSKGGLLALR